MNKTDNSKLHVLKGWDSLGLIEDLRVLSPTTELYPQLYYCFINVWRLKLYASAFKLQLDDDVILK